MATDISKKNDKLETKVSGAWHKVKNPTKAFYDPYLTACGLTSDSSSELSAVAPDSRERKLDEAAPRCPACFPVT